MAKLKGISALVTGGSRGIGAGIVERLAQEGAAVAITYSKSADAAEKVVARGRAYGVKAEALQADSGDGEVIKRVVGEVVHRIRRLDIRVNNAGIFLLGSLLDSTDEEFERMVNINVRAVFLASREAAKVMRVGGRIINIGSNLGEQVPFPEAGLYAMSKSAVAGFTRAWARDLGPKGITVNCVQPGPINTDMNPEDSDFSAAQKAGTAIGRYGQRSEVADLVLFLASAEASNITGATLNIDGGFNA
ncbi:MAG: SDR family NAD(P)-dependent oxidoreductase [Gammaproteobacteria bacterium]